METKKNDLLLKAARRLPVERTPVWMMRQAGRCDPQYRQLREQDGRPLEELFADAETSHRISLLPQRFGVDAIIMFQDILTPLKPMGAPFVFRPAPVLQAPLSTPADFDALHAFDPSEQLAHVGQLLSGLRRDLQEELPVLGFAGAPFTLACFLICGKSPMAHMEQVWRFRKEHPQTFHHLLNKLADATACYLNYQIEQGAQAVQLFESLGDCIPDEHYESFVLESHQRVLQALNRSVPAIMFVKENPRLDLMLQSGADVLSVGQCVDLAQAFEQVAGKVALQGNVPNQLLVEGSQTEVENAVRAVLKQGKDRGHILNLNHGLLPDTPLANVEAFIRAAKSVNPE